MLKNKLILAAILLIALVGCKENVKSQTTDVMEKTSGKFDLSKIDFDKDLKVLLGMAEYNIKRSDITEYITDRRTVQVDTFKFGNLEFESEFQINDMSIPSDSYLSLNTQNEETDTIIAVHMEYNFLGNENHLVKKLTEQFGEPELLSKEGSSNEFRGLKNYLWSDISKKMGLIVAQSSYGSAVGLDNDTSERIYTANIYVINNDVIIRYPNGQRKAVLDKLTERYSY